MKPPKTPEEMRAQLDRPHPTETAVAFLTTQGDRLVRRVRRNIIRAFAEMPYGTMMDSDGLVSSEVHTAFSQATFDANPPEHARVMIVPTTGKKPLVSITITIPTVHGHIYRMIDIQLTPRKKKPTPVKGPPSLTVLPGGMS